MVRMVLRMPMPNPSRDFTEEVEATLIGQMSEIAIMKTTRVTLTVSIERLGCEGLIALAEAEIDVHGFVIKIHGFEARRDQTGKLRVYSPSVSHNVSALPAVELPRDLDAAIRR